MKKVIAIGVLLLSLASCVTQKRCLQKFPPQIVTKDSIVVKDTTVYVTLRDTIPGDSVLLDDSIPCPDVQYHKEVKSPSGRTTAKVDINKGKLTVDCKVDSLNRVIDSLQVKIKTTEAYHSQVKTIEVPVVKYKTPVWAWIMLAAIALYFLIPIVIKALKK
jgi:hypothetical protein